MTDEIREAFENAALKKYGITRFAEHRICEHFFSEGYSAGLAKSNARIAKLEAHCPVSCHKREGKS